MDKTLYVIHCEKNICGLLCSCWTYQGSRVKKMSEVWNQGHLVEQFEEFYQQRNNVLHEAKLPIAFITEALAILPPAGKVDEPEK